MVKLTKKNNTFKNNFNFDTFRNIPNYNVIYVHSYFSFTLLNSSNKSKDYVLMFCVWIPITVQKLPIPSPQFLSVDLLDDPSPKVTCLRSYFQIFNTIT